MRILMATALLAATTLAGTAVTTTSAFAQGGSYQGSCRNVTSLGNGVISAECADGSGRYRSTTIQASACQGDIGNQNGMLACNGAVGQGGAYVPDNSGRNNGGRNNNNNNAAGAAVLGAVAGAFLGSNLYQGNQSYPDYGQRGYGDPRYDPRYAQGGYGYGYAQGQFVPISRRVDWLDRRIDRAQERGTLSRREASSLRSQLDDLVRMERNYGRNGFTNWERADLDNRFDDLAARIRFESRDYDNRPGQGGGYGGGYNNGGGYGGGYNR